MGRRLHDDTRQCAVDARPPGSFGADDLAVLEFLRILAEVPDVAGLVLGEIVVRLFHHFAVDERRVVDDVAEHTIDQLGLARDDGEVVEKTNDYFAQDKAGNVWYFGEDTKEFENGKVVSTEGTWRAGVEDATPGVIMLAHPRVGDDYDQE